MKQEIISLVLVAAIMGCGYGAARVQDYLNKKISPCACGVQCPCYDMKQVLEIYSKAQEERE